MGASTTVDEGGSPDADPRADLGAGFEGPWFGALLRDDEIAAHFSAAADLRAMLRFEAALVTVQSAQGLVPDAAARRIAAVARDFVPDERALYAATAIDGVVVPELVRQLRRAVGDEAAPHVHVGATSQDVIDTSLVLRLEPVVAVFERRLDELCRTLDALERRFGACPLMARTRMQAALPMTVGDRLRAWRVPLAEHRALVSTLRSRVSRLQFGGPVGTLQQLGARGPAVARALAAELGLHPAIPCWHTARSGLVELTDWASRVTGSLGKIGQDAALMAQDGIDEIALSGGGGSSAMPHKHNPVKAEWLVALARYNATQTAGMHHAMVHEQERSGAAWALEWLLLPPIVQSTGASLRLARELLASIEDIGSAAFGT